MTAERRDPDPEPDLSTLADLPFHVLGRHPKALLIGRVRNGAIEGLSTREWFDRVRDLALGLEALGVVAGDRIGIMSESRPEWLTADLAVQLLGGVTVPVYPTLTPPQAAAILADAGARFVFVSSTEQLARIQSARARVPSVETVMTFDPNAAADVPSLEDIAARGHARMVAEWGIGRQFRDRARAIRPDQLATIIYTSGTTAEPKGVMLSHRNLISNLLAVRPMIVVDIDDVSLSFLPLSHSFERLASYFYLTQGVTMVFAESMDTVARDLLVVRPTVMTGVPRVYEKFQARILEGGKALPLPRRLLFNWAVHVAMAKGRLAGAGKPVTGALAAEASIAERLVFAKIRERVGGRLRIFVSGSAPLARETGEFFMGVGLPITEGYGLTETSPILAANPPGAWRIGTVGTALTGVEIRIAEDGEIVARGPNVMMGYYNKPAETAEVIRDGWFHTGDIGVIDPEGYLTITDRKKDVLVTSGGKKVAPQPIEAALKRQPLVAEAVVLGDRHKFISALIVPDFAALERQLRSQGKPVPGRDRIAQDPAVIAIYDGIVTQVNQSLSQFERIKKIRLLPRELTIDSGELTPTMKVKRRVVEERWAKDIEAIYG